MVGMGSHCIYNKTLSNETSMNQYFYKVFIPLTIAIIITMFAWFFNQVQINWLLVLLVWFLIGPLGIGVGFHRLFSHRQFETYRPIEIVLAILGTLAAYGPILYWVSEHQHHHKHADSDKDINNPSKGFWHSFLYWRFKTEAEKCILIKDKNTIQAAKDPILVYLSKNFIGIIYLFAAITLLLGFNVFASVFVLPIFIEHLRINILNSVAHIKLPGSYRNFNSNDNSYNNILLGYITLGFGWHNNHHNNPGELVNQHHWYEVDIEGLLAKSISKS